MREGVTECYEVSTRVFNVHPLTYARLENRADSFLLSVCLSQQDPRPLQEVEH